MYVLQIEFTYFSEQNTDSHPQFTVISVIITDSVQITDGGCTVCDNGGRKSPFGPHFLIFYAAF